MRSHNAPRFTAARHADAALSLLAIGAVVLLIGIWKNAISSRASRDTAVRNAEQRMGIIRLDSLGAVGNDGLQLRIPVADGRRRVLLLLSTSCAACQRSVATWTRLATDIPPEVEVLAISTESTDELGRFIQAPRMRYLQMTHNELRTAFSPEFLPATIMTSGDGRVAFARIGQFSEAHRAQLLFAADSLADAHEVGFVRPAPK